VGAEEEGRPRQAAHIPEADRDYYLERKYPSFGNLAPRDIASRAAKEACDDGRGVGPGGLGVYLDFADSIGGSARRPSRERYGNLFEMYEKITGEIPTSSPMRIYPAVHYTMGGLWVDYNLMSNLPGLFVLGEANFSDHGANRLGASALMQGLADGYFVIPYHHRATTSPSRSPAAVTTEPRRVQEGRERGAGRADEAASTSRASAAWTASTASWACSSGTSAAWPATKAGLKEAIKRIPALRERILEECHASSAAETTNQELEKAGRVADFLEFAELMCRDALTARSLRRSLPRGTEHQYARWRGEARRRELQTTSPPGSTRVSIKPGSTKSRWSSKKSKLAVRSYK
jgi:succinate dehydrogenase / fumarate reductase flavoprotein subunit